MKTKVWVLAAAAGIGLCMGAAVRQGTESPMSPVSMYTEENADMECLSRLDIKEEAAKQIEDYQYVQAHKYDTGWTSAAVNLRARPSDKSQVLEVIGFNTRIQYRQEDQEWYQVRYKGQTGYLHKDYLSLARIPFHDYSAAVNTTKSFMPYTAITSAESPQYRLQQKAYTGTYGIRQVNGRYCVAVGSYYTTAVGTYFDLILENGTVIPCILADCKADRHTDETNRVTFDGSLAEFVVDGKALEKRIWKSGDVSSADASWDSPVKTVRIYEKGCG